jgi:uncharacterized protein (TIGR02118 family)
MIQTRQGEYALSEVKLVVLYPYPADAAQFDREYAAHLQLLHSKIQIPPQARPYTVTRFVELPSGRPAYYQMFSLPFPSAAALQQVLGSAEMQAVAADAARISSGGPPLVLVGAE